MINTINYRKILWSSVVIAFVASLVFAGTQAFFSDTETSEANTFTAGALDLRVDSVSHFNNMVCVDTDDDGFGDEWQPEDDFVPGPGHYPQPGDPCTGTWEESDLVGDALEYRFFNFDDIKPGDYGENTISLHVYDNDAWGCFYVESVENNDNGLTEPEEESGDATGGDGGGELGSYLTFDSWLDEGSTPGFQCNDPEDANTAGASCDADPMEGDNILNGVEALFWEGETVDDASEGPFNQSDVLAEAYAAHECSDATGNTDYDECHGLAEDGRMVGSATYYWGLAWNVPPETGNEIQTDSLVADMIFSATQHRNNADFSCPVLETQPPVQREAVGTVLGNYAAPTTCDSTVTDDNSLTNALSGATGDETICLEDGNYSGPVTLSVDGLTLAGVNPPVATAQINGGVIVDAPNVTVTGLKIIPGNTEGSTAGVYLKDGADNATISYNHIDSTGVTLARGVVNVLGTDLPGVSIMNNMIEGDGTGSGIYTNPHTGMWTISNNDISNWAAGIGQWNGANVLNNEFSGGGEAIGVDSEWETEGGVVNFNNFLDDMMLNTYGTIVGTIDAENNFFSTSGATQVDDNSGTNVVDFDPEEGSAFPHN